MEEIVIVGMAELKTGGAPQKIATLGLGSCIGVCVWDPIMKIGGLLHFMLPTSSIVRETTFNQAKFADTGIPLLISQLENLGGVRSRFQVKIAGGAQMFSMAGQSNVLSVGTKNVTAVEEICDQMNLPIIARSVGGCSGKSITLDLDTGQLQVKTLNAGIINI